MIETFNSFFQEEFKPELALLAREAAKLLEKANDRDSGTPLVEACFYIRKAADAAQWPVTNEADAAQRLVGWTQDIDGWIEALKAQETEVPAFAQNTSGWEGEMPSATLQAVAAKAKNFLQENKSQADILIREWEKENAELIR